MIELVELLESWQVAFLDLADFDHTVQTPEALLLTGQAQRRVSLNNVVISRKVFDRGGHLLSQEEEKKPFTGERTFTCSAAGGYELVEFIEAKP